MSVRMTSAGDFGWVSDRAGYRYERRHPDGMAWPVIPDRVLAIWRAVSGVDRDASVLPGEFLRPGAKMGLHQDRDEADFTMPVVFVSLGDDALFRVGGRLAGARRNRSGSSPAMLRCCRVRRGLPFTGSTAFAREARRF
jgi:alkylated DNA repair protein (DNA oxidative demethylase)